MRKLLILAGVMVLSLGVFAADAQAACTNPTGAEGDTIYNTTHKTMQFCDGTDWWSMKGGGGGGGGSLTCAEVNSGTTVMTSSGATSSVVLTPTCTSGTAVSAEGNCSIHGSVTAFNRDNDTTYSITCSWTNSGASGGVAVSADALCCEIQ